MTEEEFAALLAWLERGVRAMQLQEPVPTPPEQLPEGFRHD